MEVFHFLELLARASNNGASACMELNQDKPPQASAVALSRSLSLCLCSSPISSPAALTVTLIP